MKSSTIWLSDSRKSNDYLESSWADLQMEKLLANNSLISEKEKIYFLENYNSNLKSHFIFCMSKNKDLLSQWRGYADDAKGVAIGFDSNSFPNHGIPAHTHYKPDMSSVLQEVIYENDEHLENLKQCFIRARQISEFSPSNKESSFGWSLSSQALALRPIIKHESFKEEDEVRLIHTPIFATDNNNSHHIRGSNLEFDIRVSNGAACGYFKFPINKTNIKELVIGPKSKLSYEDASLIFGMHGFGNVNIFRSLSSYR